MATHMELDQLCVAKDDERNRAKNEHERQEDDKSKEPNPEDECHLEAANRGPAMV